MQKSGPRVLMVSTDRLIAIPGSAVSMRMKEYGGLVEELHIVLLSDKSHGIKETRLSSNVSVYPTDSMNKLFRPLDAVKIGRKIDCTLITTQDPFECGWVGLQLKREKNLLLEVQVHTDPFSPHFSGFLNFVRKQIARKVFRFADAVRVVRPILGKKIIEKFGIDDKKISVLPIYIDRRRISEGPKFDLHTKYGFKHVVLTVSRLSKEKNLPIIINAMTKVKDAVLVVVGSGPEEGDLRSMVKNLGINGRVMFEGWQEDLSSYYKTADILVQASSFEGYGLSIVEAGVCGLAVISTSTGIAEDFDEVYKAKDAESFAQRINYLLHNEAERRSLGESLRKILEAETYTKEAYLQKMKENWEGVSRQVNS